MIPFNSIPRGKVEVNYEREFVYITPVDRVDDRGRLVRTVERSKRSMQEAFTPQTGLETKIGNIGWMNKNHQVIPTGQGEKSIIIHHGNPFLDCQPILQLSKNLQALKEKADSARLNQIVKRNKVEKND